jgi:lipopolysaccharide biosynthesis glycosyltransferase
MKDVFVLICIAFFVLIVFISNVIQIEPTRRISKSTTSRTPSTTSSTTSSLSSSPTTPIDDSSDTFPQDLHFLSSPPHRPIGNVAIVTLITGRKYLAAACALGESLRQVRSIHPLVALLSGDAVGDVDLAANLSLAGFHASLNVPPIKNPARKFKQLPSAWFKLDIFTKFRVFQLSRFERVLFLDADLVVRRNLDELLGESTADVNFAFVPELMYHARCHTPGHEAYFFEDLGAKWCHGHTLEPYHGEMLRLSNTGVMLVKPSQPVFDALVELLAIEPSYNDTCIGLGGFCQDQRLINIYFNRHPYVPLSLTYNAFCQKLLTDDGYATAPVSHVVHYRGGKQPMKPWIDDPTSSFCTWFWQDHCGSFIDAFAEFERRAFLARRPWMKWSDAELRERLREWRRMRAYESTGERVVALARQFSAMQTFRDEFYNGIRHLESHWHTIMTAADAAPRGVPRTEQAHARYLANNAASYMERMQAALVELFTHFRELKNLTGHEFDERDLPQYHHQMGVQQRLLFQQPQPHLAAIDARMPQSRAEYLAAVEETAQQYPMYIIYDCSYRNAAKRVNDMRHMAEGALTTVTQMFQRAVFRFGNSSAFGGKAFSDRRELQTKMISEALVDLKRALNWEKEPTWLERERRHNATRAGVDGGGGGGGDDKKNKKKNKQKQRKPKDHDDEHEEG